ncbi:galactokinase [Acidicapsa acidisoli]|uniref:galactokinase n=1 Tax=Acidicapsa acidisoli TaxID=1615681 RepID=UPI0021E05982|nr:galactokinase [Acidicapsa acidisoli]
MKDPAALRQIHEHRFGVTPEIFVAPGRVNLIGEHTDYAEGFVMPVAIDFATLAAISPRNDGKIVIYAENFHQERSFPANPLPTKASGHWSDYPLGVMAILAGEGYTIPPLSLSLWGDVPLGSGLSSSAAVEVATATAVTSLIGAAIPGPKLARLCQRAENEFVGANCGIMDQFISVNGAADNALLLDCRDLSYRLAPIPANMALVIANTMVKHSVAGDGYTTRRAEVEEACRILATHRPEIKFLRDATVADLEAWGHEIPPNALKRARHVITENQRTLEAADALLRHDLPALGKLMHEAHVSYSKDFEGSCVEADTMVDLAQDLPGLIGARLTGGGFGGCTVNVVEIDEATAFAAALKERYRQTTGIDPEIHICHASAGAHRVA